MLFIFDMGGVVVHTPDNEQPVMRVLNITREQLHEYSIDEKGRNLFSLLSDGKVTSAEYWKNFSKKYGKEITADYWRLLLRPERDEKTYTLIRDLKKKNRVICGTNTIQSHYDTHICRGDYAVFDDVYASQIMGVSKPDPNFWQIILNCENVQPKDAFFTDDREENCEAAAKLGINVQHFTTPDALRSAVAKWL